MSKVDFNQLLDFLVDHKHDIDYIDIHKTERVESRHETGDPAKVTEFFTIEVKGENFVYHGKPIVISLRD